MGIEYPKDARIRITEIGSADGQSTEQHQGWGQDPLSARSVNPFFLAAWSLASSMMILGMTWLLFFTRGADISPAHYADYLPNQPEMVETSYSSTLMNTLANFMDVAPLILVVGCLLSGFLLIVHGVNYRTKTLGAGPS